MLAFIDLVAREVGRIASELGCGEADVARLVDIVRSGDADVVAGSALAALRGHAGDWRLLFLPAEAMGGSRGADLLRLAEAGEVVGAASLLEVVEAVATRMHRDMRAAGVLVWRAN